MIWRAKLNSSWCNISGRPTRETHQARNDRGVTRSAIESCLWKRRGGRRIGTWRSIRSPCLITWGLIRIIWIATTTNFLIEYWCFRASTKTAGSRLTARRWTGLMRLRRIRISLWVERRLQLARSGCRGRITMGKNRGKIWSYWSQITRRRWSPDQRSSLNWSSLMLTNPYIE